MTAMIKFEVVENQQANTENLIKNYKPGKKCFKEFRSPQVLFSEELISKKARKKALFLMGKYYNGILF